CSIQNSSLFTFRELFQAVAHSRSKVNSGSVPFSSLSSSGISHVLGSSSSARRTGAGVGTDAGNAADLAESAAALLYRLAIFSVHGSLRSRRHHRRIPEIPPGSATGIRQAGSLSRRLPDPVATPAAPVPGPVDPRADGWLAGTGEGA